MADNIRTNEQDLESEGPVPHASTQDLRLVEAILTGDESAFTSLLERYQRPLLRLALAIVTNRAVAEEVVQETWKGVIEGLSRFKGRSSLKTWIFRILINTAKTHAWREGRSRPFSSFDSPEHQNEPAVDPSRFKNSGIWIGHWTSAPAYWQDDTPENLLLAKESRIFVQDVIKKLPSSQRQVLILRDTEGVDARDVCHIMGISETNQRVPLHRARSKVRSALERHLKEGESEHGS